MATNWKNWCRLCARHEGNDTFCKLDTVCDLSALVHKYFLITVRKFIAFNDFTLLLQLIYLFSMCHPQLSPYDVTPTAICNDCVKFVFSMEKFALRCAKVDKMYSEIVYDNINILETEVHSVRYKYGLDEEEVSLFVYSVA